MYRKKKPNRGKKKEEKLPPITYDPKVFEEAFRKRLGQTPLEWVAAKVESGSPLPSVQYLFDITATAIAQNNHCAPQSFKMYHSQYLQHKELDNKNKERAGQKTVKVYYKLVRDRIPEMIESSGKRCMMETLDSKRYLELLDLKLEEELAAYQENKSLEHLAELVEVLGAVVKARGFSWDELTAIRKQKRVLQGGYENRVLLKEVHAYDHYQTRTPLNITAEPRNAGKPWTEIEEAYLIDNYDSGMSIGEIAREHGRKNGAIRARLKKLKLISD